MTPYSLPPAAVGARPAHLTGMIQSGSIGAASIQIVANETVTDDVLDNLRPGAPGPLPSAQMGIAAGALAPTADTWVPFRITHGTIGRGAKAMTGPDGFGSNAEDNYIAYEVSLPALAYPGFEAPAEQSPSTYVKLPPVTLPPPVKSPTNPFSLTLSGVVSASGTGAGAGQTVDLQLWDYDDVTGIFDDILAGPAPPLVIAHPAGAWDRLLLPYTTVIGLLADPADGSVRGNLGSSGEAQAQVYQFVEGDDFRSQPILVP